MAQKIGPQGKIAGLDISDEMLGRALKRCYGYPNVVFEKQRIELPMLYKEEFDKCSGQGKTDSQTRVTAIFRNRSG